MDFGDKFERMRVLYVSVWVISVLLVFTSGVEETDEEYYDCQGTHHPHPDDPHRYKTKVGMIWYEQACNPQQLVWDQQLCECTYPSSGTNSKADNCDDYKPGETPSTYKRWTGLEWENMSCDWPAPSGLVWNQKKCHCDWTPDLREEADAGPPSNRRPNAGRGKDECEVMVHFSFDKKVVEDSHNYWITPVNTDNIRIEYDGDAIGHKSARFDESLLVIPHFVGNVLGSVVRIQVRFRTCRSSRGSEVAIMHNGCSDAEYPSIYIGYRTKEGRLVVSLFTESSTRSKRVECTLRNRHDDNRFKELDLRYQDNVLAVTVDGNECIRSREFTGALKVTKCPMRMPDFDFCGNLDEVKISRGCRD